MKSLNDRYASREAQKYFPEYNGELPPIEVRTTFWLEWTNEFSSNVLHYKKGKSKIEVLNFISEKLNYFDVFAGGNEILFRNGEDMLFVRLSFPDCFT